MAHAHSQLYGLAATGLRFFTVYCPWGRPDMAYFLFSIAIIQGRPITLFNHGRMRRDFTYIDDVTEAMERLLDHIPRADPGWSGEHPDPGTSSAPYVGNSRAIEPDYLVGLLERALNRPAIRQYGAMQAGDVPETWADIADLAKDIGFEPRTSIEDSIFRFAEWYRGYHAEAHESGAPPRKNKSGSRGQAKQESTSCVA